MSGFAEFTEEFHFCPASEWLCETATKKGPKNSLITFGPLWPWQSHGCFRNELNLANDGYGVSLMNQISGKTLAMLILLCLSGCGDSTQARLDVAKTKLLDQIDDALGKMDVQKAEIDNGIKSAKQATDGVRKAKIKAQVSLDQLDEKVRPYQDKIAKCDETLAKLRDAIKADIPADFGGKTYTVVELKDMAGKVINSRKECEDQVKGFETARQSMQNVVATISNQQQELESRITKLQATNSKLDAEMSAAKAMKQASSTMGDGSSTLTENLDELEKKLASLSADVRGELAGESEKWSPAGADKAISDVDAFIKSAQTPSDPVAEIDRK